MKLLLLFGFVAIAFATVNNIHADTRANLHFAASNLQVFHNGEAPIIPKPVQLQAVNATACVEAWQQLADLLNSSCGNVAVLYSNDTTGVNITQVIEDQCMKLDANGHTCEQKVTAAIIKFSDRCSGPGLINIDTAARDSLNLWLTMAKIPCLQYNGEYCYIVFQSHLTAFTAQMDSGAAVTPDLLDQICIPCVNKVVNELAIWGIKEFVALSIHLKIACTKRNNSYCMPQFIAATQVQGVDTTAELDAVCNDCVRVIAYRLWIANLLLGSQSNLTQRAELQNFLAFSGFLCQQNGKNEYCYHLLQNYDSSAIGPACAAVLVSPSGCPGSECQTQIKKFSSSVGCCFGTWFNFLQFEYDYNRTQYMVDVPSGAKPSDIRFLVEDVCKVNIPLSCANQKLVVTWAVLNILSDWYTAHKTWFEDNFRQVVAYILSVDANIVVDITSTYDASKGGVIVSVAITGFNNAIVNHYAQYLKDHLQIVDDANSVLAGIKDQTPQGASQQNTIADPITVSALSVTTACADATCWACSLSTPSFSLLALLLLLAYFN